MGAVAVFNYSAWQALYPEFINVTSPQAANYFTLATVYLRNDGTGPVQNTTLQTTLLNYLTAHIAYMAGMSTAQGATSTSPGTAPGLVGRVNSASEGSVSVSAELGNMPQGAAYFTQSPYGLAFWQASAQFRTAMYRPGRIPVFNYPFSMNR